MKKKVLYNHFYSDVQLFCSAITDCLNKTHTE